MKHWNEISELFGIPRLTLFGWKNPKDEKYMYYRNIIAYGLKAMSREEAIEFIDRAENLMRTDGIKIPEIDSNEDLGIPNKKIKEHLCVKSI